MDTLDILCNAYGWQGGTIHSAIAHFRVLDRTEQDKVFSDIMRNLSNITDLENVKELSKIRTSHLTFKGV